MEEISVNPGGTDLPFSDAIKLDNMIFVSGQGPIDPESGDIVGNTVQDQTKRTMQNIERILEAGGSSLEHLVKATVYLQNMEDYAAVNEEYRQHLTEPYPARTAVEVVDLPVDIDIEIEVVAEIPE